MRRIFLLAVLFAACTASDAGPATTSTAPPVTTTVPAGSSTLTGEAEQWTPPGHPIQIENGQFIDIRTGELFVPRGVNYLKRVRLESYWEDQTFRPSIFDRGEVESDFAALASRGYNTVRIFLDTCNGSPDCLATSDGLNPDYLATIVEVMEVAKEHGLVLILTSNDLPDGGGYWELSDRDVSEELGNYRAGHYFTPSGEEAAVRYWTDLMGGLVGLRAPFDAVLGWSVLNEQWIPRDQPPLNLAEGSVSTKTGTYDMADVEEKRQMVIDGVRSYMNAVAETIKRFDPGGLVTSGFFAPQFPNPTEIGGGWYVDTQPLVEESDLDFFDFHAYPGVGLSVAEQAENFGITNEKPVVMGEIGAFVHLFPDIERAALVVQNWIAESCEVGWDGWLYWEYDEASVEVGDATWAFTQAKNLLMDTLAPAAQPDPCTTTLQDPNLALNAQVNASQSLPNEPPANAVDGDPTTQWGSGDEPVQWLEIDLGSPQEIGVVRALVGQFPSGPTTHQLSIDGIVVDTVSAETDDNDLVSFDGMTPTVGQVIRITTLASPSWVSWKDIEVLAP